MRYVRGGKPLYTYTIHPVKNAPHIRFSLRDRGKGAVTMIVDKALNLDGRGDPKIGGSHDVFTLEPFVAGLANNEGALGG